MKMKLQLTQARLLRRLLDSPQQPRFPLDLARETGLPAGTAASALAQLERAGMVTGRREQGAPRELQRPQRLYYLLTQAGERYAREQLAALADELRPPPAA